nr:uncharacterized protein LOC104115153 [Nicotiana tomentosiformis]
MERNAKVKKILICGLSHDEYNRISVCSNAKQIWDALQITHEGTNQVKRSKIELLMRNYELFSMKESEPIQDMMIRFTIITNELKSLGMVFTSEELVSKVLIILPASWESKFTAIQEAKEFDKISLDELVGNLKTNEMRKIELRNEEPKKDKALVLKASGDDESDYDDPDLAIFSKFNRFMKNSKTYEDSGSDQEKEKEDEAISLYAVIDEHQAVETEPPVHLGMHIGRPPLSLSRNTLLRVSSCISAHDIWRTLKTDFGNENIEVALMAIEESKIEEEVIGMMAMSNSETEDETNQLISNLSCVKLDIKELESDKANLEKQVKDLNNHVLELTSKNEKSPDIHGKEKMSDLQDKLEKELKIAKYNLYDAKCRNKDKMGGNNQDWYLDSGCSRYMTGEKKNFLSPTAFQGGNVSFENGKKGQITGIDKDEDYDIELTGDGVTKESEPQHEDGFEDHKEIDSESSLLIQIRPWKHQSSHPLDNIISDPNVGVQTRSSLRNVCALTTFLSQFEPKTIKESLKDPYYIIAKEEKLNQFERSKEEVFVKQPSGFESEEFPNYVFKLDKALYGLK